MVSVSRTNASVSIKHYCNTSLEALVFLNCSSCIFFLFLFCFVFFFKKNAEYDVSFSSVKVSVYMKIELYLGSLSC